MGFHLPPVGRGLDLGYCVWGDLGYTVWGYGVLCMGRPQDGVSRLRALCVWGIMYVVMGTRYGIRYGV